MNQLYGVAASAGIALGPVYQYRQVDLKIDNCLVTDIPAEIKLFEAALDTAEEQIQAVYQKARQEISQEQAAIFEAHLTMLRDPELLDATRSAIENESQNACMAWKTATEFFAQMLEGMGNEYFQARAADVRDVGQRVLRILLGVADTGAAGLKAPSIIIAPDLTPSDTINLDKSLVLGFCTAAGGETSHTAILARSLGIPAIVGAGDGVLSISANTPVVMDGSHGLLVVDPPAEEVTEWLKRQEALEAIRANARAKCHEPAVTKDGHAVEVVANIGGVKDAKKAIEFGAEGVGLLRTEFLYLERESLADEEEQVQVYKDILKVFGNMPVVLRTLDIGGDKEVPYMDLPKEMNPFLGVRGLRLCLNQPELFRTQLRAAIRAGAGHNLKIMFPMVAALNEVRAARQIFEDCRAELIREGKDVAEKIELGIMVEVPSAAVMADRFAREVDFFSIGTNDLTQYTLAVDRTNAALSYLTSAFSPAVLTLIANVIQAAHKYGKWVGLCGELAGEPLAIPILLGLGLDEFSMNAPAVPLAKQIMRVLDVNECKEIAKAVLALESPEDVKQYIRERLPFIQEQ